MAFAEDFAVFFADFGVSATPNSGAAVTVIFDRAHIQAMGGEISGTGPIALAVSADVAAFVPHTTTLSIAGNTYTLRDMQPDGTGMTLLVLELS
jgi:hypothetical protein